MFAVIKRILFVLFWETIALLIILVIKPYLYIPWLIFCFIFIIFLFYISSKIIPTKKEKKKLKELSLIYKSNIEREYDIKSKANLLEFTCPACEYVTNYWEFIHEDECPKCSSKLWKTKIMDKGTQYYEIFKEKEETERFFSKLSFRLRNKLKKLIFET